MSRVIATGKPWPPEKWHWKMLWGLFFPRDPISEGAAGERQKRKHQGTPYQVPYQCSEATIVCWAREPGPMRSPVTPPRQVWAGRAAALPLSACLHSSLLKAAMHRQSCQRICICRMLSGRMLLNPKQQRDGSKSADRKHLLLTSQWEDKSRMPHGYCKGGFLILECMVITSTWKHYCAT